MSISFVLPFWFMVLLLIYITGFVFFLGWTLHTNSYRDGGWIVLLVPLMWPFVLYSIIKDEIKFRKEKEE